MTNPTVCIYRDNKGAVSLCAINDTYPHKDIFKSAGYTYGQHEISYTWHVRATGQADLARLIVAAADAGITVYQANRTTVISTAQIEQARKQLAAG